MANYITTLKDDNEVNTLSPTTVLKAVRDDNGNYLDNGLAASDINKLKGGEVVKLEENLARIETSPTTHAYSVGERLVYNGILYRVKAAISVGDDLVVNTNIEKKSVDDALSDITVYSTTEKAVGKWINGNTIYCKVCSFVGNTTIAIYSEKSFAISDLPSQVSRFIKAELISYDTASSIGVGMFGGVIVKGISIAKNEIAIANIAVGQNVSLPTTCYAIVYYVK